MKPEKRRLWKRLLDAWQGNTPACQVFLAERFTQKFPDDFFGWIILADGLTHLSSFEKAAKALCTSRRLSSSEQVRIFYRKTGNYYREKGDLKRAERWYRKALAVSESQESHVSLGACLAKQGRYAEARYHHQKAAEFDPQKADEALFNLGLIARAETDFLEALRYFELAIELDSDYDDAKIAREDILQLLKIRSSLIMETGRRKKASI